MIRESRRIIVNGFPILIIATILTKGVELEVINVHCVSSATLLYYSVILFSQFQNYREIVTAVKRKNSIQGIGKKNVTRKTVAIANEADPEKKVGIGLRRNQTPDMMINTSVLVTTKSEKIENLPAATIV